MKQSEKRHPGVNRSGLLLVVVALFFVNSAFAQPAILQKADSLVQVAEQSDDPMFKMKIYSRLAPEMMNYDPQKTYEYAGIINRLAQASDEKGYLLESYKWFSAYFMVTSMFDSSLYYSEQALVIARELEDAMNEANLLRDRGRLFYLQGRYPQALDATFKAVAIFETLGDNAGMATSYSSIANIYSAEEKFEQAVKYGLLALDIAYEMDNKIGVINITGNLATMFMKMDSVEKAIKYYQIAVETAKQMNYPPGVALNQTNMALSYLSKNQFVKALDLLTEANSIYKMMNDSEGLALTNGNIGELYLRNYKLKNEELDFDEVDVLPGAQNDILNNAIRHLEIAIDFYKKSGRIPAIAYFSEQLSQAYEIEGNHNKALEYYKAYTQAQDSIKNTESKIKIEELTTQREIDLKNKQIELDRLEVLKKRNERVYFIIGLALFAIALAFIYRNFANQKAANLQLTQLNGKIALANTQLEEKNTSLSQTLKALQETQEQLIATEKQKEKALVRARISQDIHDDISSGLAKISWLAELLKARTSQAETAPDDKTISKIISFSKESVAKLGEIIWSTNPERDNLESLIAYLRNYINGYMEGLPFNLKISFQEGSHAQKINPELRRNLYLVMKEALHNAVKYSEAADIEVKFELNGSQYKLVVADNGKGMDQGVVKGGGFGIGNMHRRMESVRGKAEFISAPGKGTAVIFSGEVF